MTYLEMEKSLEYQSRVRPRGDW